MVSTSTSDPNVASAHALTALEVARTLDADPDRGLSEVDAAGRLARHGANALREVPRPGLVALLAEQFNDFLIWLLLVAAVVAAVVGYVDGEGYADSLAIIAIVALNAVMGVVQQRRAENALRALQAMAAPDATIVRDGLHRTIPARDIVPGDIVFIEAGNFVPADLRLVEAVNLRVDESSLTGESVAVLKDADALLEPEAQRAEQRNMAFGGTVTSYGRGRGIVVGTGMDTAIGQIATLLQSYDREPTPLQQRLAQLGRTLGLVTLAVCVVVFVVGLWRETDLGLLAADPTTYLRSSSATLVNLFMVAVSLAIAAVPEGLPAVVTISLAIGMQRMIARHALIRRLPAVETLGSATTICSDKTGTLTQNEMMVVRAEVHGPVLTVTGEGYAPDGTLLIDGEPVDPGDVPELRLLAAAGTLASDALVEFEGGRWRVVGDPTEGALVTFAARAHLDRRALEHGLPRVAEIPFDSVRKRMTTIHRVDVPEALPESGQRSGSVIAFVKGAPDFILGLSTHYHRDGRPQRLDAAMRAEVTAANDRMASEALRVLAVAYRILDRVPDAPDAETVERDLVLVGLVGMMDPPRPEVAEAVARARGAGVRTVMITGDYRDTAVAVARELGILQPGGQALSGADLDGLDDAALSRAAAEVDVFARVSPEHKVRIVEALKARGEIVSMTGDGVNDAPALKRAHIGVAMGLTGTDVSRETADMVLTDDNYASIVAAIEEGRTIYDNIRKFVFYLLSCNVGEVLIIFVATLLALANEPPLVPIQLLWLNLVTDGLPALALGLEAAERDVMRRPPRDPGESIITRDMWSMIAVQSVVDAFATLAAFVWAYDGPETLRFAQTVAFATLVTAELLRAFTSRSEIDSIFRIGLLSNRWMVLATSTSFALLLVALYVPHLHEAFGTTTLGLAEWGPIAGFALLPATAFELLKAWRRRRRRLSPVTPV
jgi:P-type Ca2+ transporter type 2C